MVSRLSFAATILAPTVCPRCQRLARAIPSQFRSGQAPDVLLVVSRLRLREEEGRVENTIIIAVLILVAVLLGVWLGLQQRRMCMSADDSWNRTPGWMTTPVLRPDEVYAEARRR